MGATRRTWSSLYLARGTQPQELKQKGVSNFFKSMYYEWFVLIYVYETFKLVIISVKYSQRIVFIN